MNGSPSNEIDPQTESAARDFIHRVVSERPIRGAFLFGSRARGSHRAHSDADVAVLLPGERGPRLEVALHFADIAFDVMLDTGVLIDAIPFWEGEWVHPERFSNPALIENIRREGLAL